MTTARDALKPFAGLVSRPRIAELPDNTSVDLYVSIPPNAVASVGQFRLGDLRRVDDVLRLRPTTEQILEKVSERLQPTYAIRNRLALAGFKITTAEVRRALTALAKAGKVVGTKLDGPMLYWSRPKVSA